MRGGGRKMGERISGLVESRKIEGARVVPEDLRCAQDDKRCSFAVLRMTTLCSG